MKNIKRDAIKEDLLFFCPPSSYYPFCRTCGQHVVCRGQHCDKSLGLGRPAQEHNELLTPEFYRSLPGDQRIYYSHYLPDNAWEILFFVGGDQKQPSADHPWYLSLNSQSNLFGSNFCLFWDTHLRIQPAWFTDYVSLDSNISVSHQA